MTLSSGLNNTYRPSSVNVTEKYTPLLDIQVTSSDTDIVREMACNRMDVLASLGVQVSRLTYLATRSISQYASQETGKNPPLIVVSSNRSNWIKNGFENANGILEGIVPAVTNFNSVTDPRPLAAGAVPFYLPIRMSAAEANTRNVYIFVASDEYSTYYKALKETNINVIGWRTEGNERLSGFGASRYAALEFFKHIFTKNGACGRVWMLDDNVAYIRSFPGLAAVEGQLGALFGLGFRGGTQVEPDSEFSQMASKPLPPPVANNSHEEAPILQQAVLWNVARFVGEETSFSPYFMTSAEDTSLTKFLGLANCQYYNGCKILKGSAAPDKSLGAQAFQGAKRDLLGSCYSARNEVPFTSAAVPGVVTLSGVINAARDAAKSPPRISNVADEENVMQTYSKALEQILSAALDKNIVLPKGLFKPSVPRITSKLMPNY